MEVLLITGIDRVGSVNGRIEDGHVVTTALVQTLEEASANVDAVVDRIGFKVSITIQVVDIVPRKNVRDWWCLFGEWGTYQMVSRGMSNLA